MKKIIVVFTLLVSILDVWAIDSQKLVLPNGDKFKYWEDQTKYKRILHVAQQHPNASDKNDGSENSPFLTIQHAADLAGPGDLVLIGEGIYRETIRPKRSGLSEKEMICFQGVDKNNVIVTGSEIYNGEYKKSEGWAPYRSHFGKGRKNAQPQNIEQEVIYTGSAKNDVEEDKSWSPDRHTDEDNLFLQQRANVYMFKFPYGTFVDVNPFAMTNGPLVAWVGEGSSFIYMWAKEDTQQKLALMRRGMLFCDGKKLTQVAGYLDIAKSDGTFFVEDDGLTIHLRLPGDAHPKDHLIEFTAREQCFVPEERYSSYIKVENITFIKAGNGFSPPQRGAVSTNCGNHFIIHNCVVEDANGIGIDIGFQLPARYSMAPRGNQTVSGCIIRRCGMAGLCGTTGCSDIDYYEMQQENILIMNNQLYDNCWQDFSQLHESASIKMHHLKNSMIIGNYIQGNKFGHGGIWTDAANENMAICENIIIDSQEHGIYVEASNNVNEVSGNIIINAQLYGIYGSETDHLHCNENIILNCKKGGINIKYGGNRFFLGKTFTGHGMKVCENIISGGEYAVFIPGITDGHVNANFYGQFSKEKYLRAGNPPKEYLLAGWQSELNWDRDSYEGNISYHLSAERLEIIFEGKEQRMFSVSLSKPIKEQVRSLKKTAAKN